jgi:chemotaxis protein histidine kinase CheA
LENRCFLDLLDLSDKHRQHYLSLAEEIFEDTLGPGSEDLYLVQLPTRFKTIDGRWLNIEASIVRDENEHLDSILYTVNDVSDLMKVHEQNNRNWAMLNIIKQKDAFLSFLEDTRTQIQICYEALQNEEEKILRRHLHTIKGNTAAYEIVHIVNYIHDLEDKEVIRHDDIWEIENLFRTFLRENYDILEIPYDANESSSLEVHRNHLDELMSIVSQLPGTEAKTIHNWIHKVSRRPTRIYLGPINQFVHKLSERLNKDFEFCVTGDDVLVPENTKALFHSVSHLIRNAIDHGVEKPGERTKPGRCSVQLKIQDTDKGVYIEVTDDGRGIDTAKISQKALDLGLIDQKRFDNMSYDDKCRLILLDSLSAADTVTEISGRGVGMSAVVSEVEDLGGELQIHSRENEGASFKILIPRKAK